MPLASVPMKLPATTINLVDEPATETPSLALPEITLRSAAVLPPTVSCSEDRPMTTPTELPMATVPVRSVPMKLREMVLKRTESLKLTPAPVLPETTLADPAPPTVMLLASRTKTPTPFGRATSPVASTPMSLPATVICAPPSMRMPNEALPEMRLPRPSARSPPTVWPADDRV